MVGGGFSTKEPIPFGDGTEPNASVKGDSRGFNSGVSYPNVCTKTKRHSFDRDDSTKSNIAIDSFVENRYTLGRYIYLTSRCCNSLRNTATGCW